MFKAARLLVAGVFVVLALGGVGCAHGSKAQMFSPLTEMAPDQGVVYVYRPKGFVGSAVVYKVHANGTPVSALPPGRYFVYQGVGPVEFSAKTEIRTAVTIDIQPGQTYYIKGGVLPGAFIGNALLQQVTPDRGEAEIVKCSLAQ